MFNVDSKQKIQCVKDVDILFYTEYLHGLFPNAKFIYMIRDGRAAAYSLIINKYVVYEQDQNKVKVNTENFLKKIENLAPNKHNRKKLEKSFSLN